MTDKGKISLPAFYGIKAGMTRVFDEQGNHVPVSVIKLIPNYITQVKNQEKDGYESYQVGFYEKREKLVNKPIKGHLAKASLPEANVVRFAEIKTDSKVNPEDLGKVVSVENFKTTEYVDVTGITKGKGFQGVMKVHGFQGGPASHGSHFHRRPGSIGNRATPARVFKGRKMPKQMGNDNRTVQNLLIVAVNVEEGYMLIKGSVPGSKNGFVKISKATKKVSKA